MENKWLLNKMKERNEYIILLSVSFIFVGFTFWLYIYGLYTAFAYHDVKVTTFNCKIYHLNQDGCNVIDLLRKKSWYVQPCISQRNETQYLERCATIDRNKDNFPVLESYYEQSDAVYRYKLANFIIVIIVPFIIGGIYLLLLKDEILFVSHYIWTCETKLEYTEL